MPLSTHALPFYGCLGGKKQPQRTPSAPHVNRTPPCILSVARQALHVVVYGAVCAVIQAVCFPWPGAVVRLPVVGPAMLSMLCLSFCWVLGMMCWVCWVCSLCDKVVFSVYMGCVCSTWGVCSIWGVVTCYYTHTLHTTQHNMTTMYHNHRSSCGADCME